MPLSPGQRLGNYEVVAPLGAGGMAEVHRARDLRLGRMVALKVLPDSVAASAPRLALIEREARTLAGLNHPNIVVLHALEDHGGVRFLCMELVEGRNLQSLVQPGGLPLPQLLEIARPLAEALAAAHERGVVHRDLKPANVMLTHEGRVKVLDFGLAKWTQDQGPAVAEDTPTATIDSGGMVMGTVPYMSPEQLHGSATDETTDLFSLGVLLYELAAGERPFRGPTAAVVTSAILRDEPAPLSAKRPDLPDAFTALVHECLAKDPRARGGSAHAIAERLLALQRGPVRAPAAAAAVSDDAIRSLVVLPLANVSHDAAQEYFVDGMTEALIGDLSQLPGLRVISRTSAMRFKGVHRALPEIARELNVDAVLEGSAVLVQDRVRISVQLVSAKRDATLWSARYDRRIEDVLDLQAEVAGKVAQGIALHLSPSERRRLERRQSVNPEAHIEYLRGQHSVAAMSPQAVELALRHFERALSFDPEHAPSWAGIAHCHNVRWARGMAPPAEATAAAQAAAERALAIDDSLAEAHAEMGMLLNFLGQREAARHELERAVSLNPGLTRAHAELGRLHYISGRHTEAQACMRRAAELDPLSMLLQTNVGDAYYYAREYAKSVPHYRRAIELDPRFDGAHTDLARSLEALGQFEEARREYEAGRALAGGVAGPSFGLAHLAASMGDTATARRMLDELIAARQSRVVSAWGIAVLHASLGDADQAFAWLDRAIQERASGLTFLRVHPRLDPIRNDPRYAELLARYAG